MDAFSKCLREQVLDLYERFREVKDHFAGGESNVQQDAAVRVAQVVASSDLLFEAAYLRTGKTDQVTQQDVLFLKDKIIGILSKVPSQSLSQMLRSWSYFRLSASGFWKIINDKFLVDSSISEDLPLPVSSIQNGRISKNLLKLDIAISNV